MRSSGRAARHSSRDPSLCLRNVPILFINSAASQETVSWSAYPHDIGGPIYQMYRHDHDDNPGVAYEPRNDMIGINWDMAPGHFDMLPRDFEFTANWLAAVAEARLPAKPGDPLKDLTLRDGWLINPVVPVSEICPRISRCPRLCIGGRARAREIGGQVAGHGHHRIDEPAVAQGDILERVAGLLRQARLGDGGEPVGGEFKVARQHVEVPAGHVPVEADHFVRGS